MVISAPQPPINEAEVGRIAGPGRFTEGERKESGLGDHVPKI